MLPLKSLAALLLAAAQPSQPAAPEEADIVVRAQTEQEVDRFVAALTQARGAEQIARWNGRICPNVLGLDPGQAAYVRGRIAEAAPGRSVSRSAHPAARPIS